LWLSCPNFKQLSYIYDRYRIVQVACTFFPLSPLQGAGQTPLFVRYNPTILSDPLSASYITDALNSKSFNPNKTTPTSWSFIPKFSTPPLTESPTEISVPDQDGFIPFSVGSTGFCTPFCGSLQYWQDTTSSFGDPEWSITVAFLTECVYPS